MRCAQCAMLTIFELCELRNITTDNVTHIYAIYVQGGLNVGNFETRAKVWLAGLVLILLSLLGFMALVSLEVDVHLPFTKEVTPAPHAPHGSPGQPAEAQQVRERI
jgi:hypothetical protein